MKNKIKTTKSGRSKGFRSPFTSAVVKGGRSGSGGRGSSRGSGRGR